MNANQNKFKCRHIKCDQDGCYCSINKGAGYNHCVLPYYQAECKYYIHEDSKMLDYKTISKIKLGEDNYG